MRTGEALSTKDTPNAGDAEKHLHLTTTARFQQSSCNVQPAKRYEPSQKAKIVQTRNTQHEGRINFLRTPQRRRVRYETQTRQQENQLQSYSNLAQETESIDQVAAFYIF